MLCLKITNVLFLVLSELIPIIDYKRELIDKETLGLYMLGIFDLYAFMDCFFV